MCQSGLTVPNSSQNKKIGLVSGLAIGRFLSAILAGKRAGAYDAGRDQSMVRGTIRVSGAKSLAVATILPVLSAATLWPA